MVTNGLIIFCYCLVAYGLSNMMVFGSGPFRIFEHIRSLASSIGEHFGLLFQCMMCFPANFGWIMSLIDWFLLPKFAFTPFNIILAGTGYWWLALLLDCCFTTGIVWIIHHIALYFENMAESADPNSIIVEEKDPDNIEVDDITRNHE